MTTNVGGVSIGIFADVRSLRDGVKTSIAELDSFRKRLNKIRLAGAITGDPFSATKKYMKEATAGLNRVFSKWSDNVSATENKMSRIAKASARNAESVIKDFGKITTHIEASGNKLEAWVDILKKVQQGSPNMAKLVEKDTGILSKTGSPLMGAAWQKKLKADPEAQKSFQEFINSFKGFTRTADAIVSDFEKKMQHKTGVTYAQFKAFLANMSAEITSSPLIAELEAMTGKIAKSFKVDAAFRTAQRMITASDPKIVEEERIGRLQDLREKELKLSAEIKAGIKVRENKLALVRNLLEKEKEGGVISEGQRAFLREQAAAERALINQKELRIEQHKKETAEVNKLSKALEYTAAREARRKGVSVSGEALPPKEMITGEPNRILQERVKLILASRLEIGKAKEAISQNFQIEKNRLVVIQALNRLKKAGVEISKGEILAQELASKQAKYKEEIADASNIIKARERQVATLNKLTVAETKLRTEIKAGIKVRENKLALVRNLQTREKEGGRLNEEQADFLKSQAATERALINQKELRIEQHKKEVAALKKVRVELELTDAIKGKQAGFKARGITPTRQLSTEDTTSVYKKSADLIKSANQEIAKAYKLIEKNFNVEKNRLVIIRKLNELKGYGVRISKAELQAQTKLYNKDTYTRELKDAGDLNKARERQVATSEKLVIAEAKLRAERKVGIGVQEFRNNLAKIYQQRQANGEVLLNKEVAALNKYNKSLKRGGFLSKDWFKQRAGWFIQLRAFWGIYRAASEAFTAVKKFEEELKNLQAVTKSTSAQLANMKDISIALGKTMSVELTTIASGMVKLGQAGLDVVETSSAIKDVTTLAVATMTDMTTASDLVTTAMKAWGEETDDTALVVDILANTVNRSKVTIDGLSTALQYVTGVAPQVGMSFKETSGVIGILANQGIKLSKVGTGLRSLLGELLRPSKRFTSELHKVGLTLSDIDVKTRGFTSVLEDLQASGFDATSAFKGLDRRAASAISALISQAGSVREFSESLSDAGSAATMASTQMESLNSKITITKNKINILASQIYDFATPLMKLGTDVLGGVVTGLTEMDSKIVHVISTLTTGGIILLISGLTYWLYSSIKAFYMFSLGVSEATTVLGFFAIGLTKVRAALAFLVTGPGAIIGISVALLVTLVAHIAKSTYALSDLAKKAVESRNKFYKLNAEYENFKDLTEKYTKAVKEHNYEQARKIAAMDKELNSIHLLGLEEDEQIKRIKKITELKKELSEQQLRSARENEAAMANLTASQALQDVTGITPSAESTDVYGVSGTPARSLDERRADADKKLQRVFATMRNSADVIISKNKDVSVSVKDIILQLKIAGYSYDTIKEAAIVAGSAERNRFIEFEDYLKEQLKIQEVLNTKAREWKKIAEEVDKIDKAGGVKKGQDLTYILDLMVDANVELQNFKKNYSGLFKKLKKGFKDDPQTALKFSKAVTETLGKTTMETVTEIKEMFKKSKILEPFLGDMEKAKASLVTLVRAFRLNSLQEALGGFLDAKSVDDMNVKIAQFAEKVELIGKKRIGVESEITAILKEAAGLLKGYGLTSKQIIEIEKLRAEAIRKTRIEYSKTLDIENRGLQASIDKFRGVNEFERKRTELRAKFLEDEMKAQDAIGVLEEKKSRTPQEEDNLKRAKDNINLLRLNNSLAEERITIEEEIYRIRDKTEAKLIENTKERIQLEIDEPTNKLAMIELEKEAIDLKLKESYLIQDLEITSKEQYDLQKDINKLEADKLKIREKQKRAASIMYDITGRMKDQMQNFHDIMTEVGVMFATGMASGLGSTMSDFAGGFQEQQQEVKNLKGELADLDNEYQDALSDGNMERAQEIADEMARLRKNIDDLEDPIHNLKEAFKDFFKSLIDDIRAALSQWIAMQAVMGIVNSVAGAWQNPGYTGGNFSPYVAAHGGVLPRIDAFQSFSSGGLTGNPTLALLGDNKSGRELVIPEENIQKDSVHGYTRATDNKQPINVINVLTKDDIVGVMSGASGERVILNTIGKDLRSNGPISKRLRV